MKIKSKRPLYVLAAGAAVFLAAWSAGISLAVNTSPSMPRGLYLEVPVSSPKRGEIVAVCIPDKPGSQVYRERDYLGPSTRCPVGMPPELKPLAAGPGDTVTVTAAGTRVNGVLLPNSRVFDTDSQGLPIAHLPIGWTKQLAAGEWFTLAHYIPRSLDSRYYGPVHRADIRGRVFPLLTE